MTLRTIVIDWKTVAYFGIRFSFYLYQIQLPVYCNVYSSWYWSILYSLDLYYVYTVHSCVIITPI